MVRRTVSSHTLFLRPENRVFSSILRTVLSPIDNKPHERMLAAAHDGTVDGCT
jgi:hypothetical protein